MKKLFLFQNKVGAIAKDSTNPFFKSKYFDINKLIEEVKPILNELGLILIQPLTVHGDKPALRTVIIDSETDKVLVDDLIVLPENNDPQKMGSIISYYRRYAIQSLLFLQAVDDDGESVSHPEISVAKQKEQIANLLKQAYGELTTAEQFQDACIEATGLKLSPENYSLIIKKLI